MATVTHTLYNEDNSWRYDYTYTVGFTHQYDISTYSASPVNYFPYTSSGFPSIPKNGYEQYWLVGGTDIEYRPGTYLSVTECFYQHMNYGYAKDISLYNRYRKLVYTLTLDKNGGTGGTDKIYYWLGKWYSSSSTSTEITQIEIPTKTGYTFGGYGNIIDAEGNIDSTKSISGNTTLTATWNANPYTVTLNLNNPMTDDDKTPSCSKDHIDVTYNTAYGALPTPTRYGYTFAGWYTQATGGTQITSSTIYNTAGDSTIYAHWTVNQYTVTARNSEGILSVKVGNNPSGTTSTGTYNYWSQVTISAEVDEETEPSPGTQYLFSEWLDLNNLSPSGAPQPVSDQNPYTFRVKEDTDYEATTYSDARVYTVTLTSNEFISNYGHYEGEQQSTGHTITGLLYGDEINLWATPSNDNRGYCEFDGWFNGNIKVGPDNITEDPTTDYIIKVKGNITLTAKASLVVPRFEIKLKNNGYNHTNQNGGVVSINYIDGYGYGSANKLVNPGETKSVYVLRELANDSSLTLKVESTEYGYQFNDWEKGSWSSTDPEWQARTITQEGTYEANFDLWNKDGATWKGYYIFVKTKDTNLPWKIVKEIDVRVKEDNEKKWKESSKAPSQQ